MKTKLTHCLAAKVAAFFLLVASAWLALGCAVGAAFLLHFDFYTQSQAKAAAAVLEDMAYSDGCAILGEVLAGGDGSAHGQGTNLRFEVFDAAGAKLAGNYSEAALPGESWRFEFTLPAERASAQAPVDTSRYTVRLYVDAELREHDRYAFYGQAIGLAYELRYAVYGIGALALGLVLVCFIFLLCAAGRQAGQETVQPGPLARLPFDLYTLALWSAMLVLGLATAACMFGPREAILAAVLGGTAELVLAVLWCMNFAVRIKCGAWWRNTLVFFLLRWGWRAGKALANGLGTMARGLPLVWRTALVWWTLSLLTLLGLCSSARVLLWFIANLLLFPAVLYLALMLRRLEQASVALAGGNLSYQVDTQRLRWGFRDAGENLNRIAEGMTRAVNERTKSERFKTELITNVSHDIKTPLTSIINYADLIGREEPGSEKIHEYAGVLLRQSERLKKLIEDLVEASKASSGSMEVHLAPCEVGVLLTQTAGEYGQRLSDGGLELITRQPETPVRILADGRLLWRVFDNLMSNICKYSQRGTRVYVTVETRGERAVITFKNTSNYALGISADELMERFVRGDASRSSEGNGLGLAIARSLVELQKGRLALLVDGDLFKVTLSFELID